MSVEQNVIFVPAEKMHHRPENNRSIREGKRSIGEAEVK
jgi:hypothetical protein